MHALQKAGPGERTPALARLLNESALYRAALGACGFPVAILDAQALARPVVYVNAAFEELFGYAEHQALGRGLAELVLRGDEPLAHQLLVGGRGHWQINAWTRHGVAHRVELTIGAVRGAEARITYWVLAFAAVR